MGRLTIDEYYLEILKLVAERTTCIRRAVGAIITTEKGQVLSTGYNGVPSGMVHCVNQPCEGAMDESGQTDRCQAVHAEQNALLQCRSLEMASTLYVTCTPCFTCAKMIANTSIRKVVAIHAYSDRRGEHLLREAGVTVLTKYNGS